MANGNINGARMLMARNGVGQFHALVGLVGYRNARLIPDVRGGYGISFTPEQ